MAALCVGGPNLYQNIKAEGDPDRPTLQPPAAAPLDPSEAPAQTEPPAEERQDVAPGPSAPDPSQIEFSDGISGGDAQSAVRDGLGELGNVRLLGQDGSGYRGPSSAGEAADLLGYRQEENAASNPGIDPLINAAEVNCSTVVHARGAGVVSEGTLRAFEEGVGNMDIGNVGEYCGVLVRQMAANATSTRFYGLRY